MKRHEEPGACQGSQKSNREPTGGLLKNSAGEVWVDELQ